MTIRDSFKPHLLKSQPYQGGSTRPEHGQAGKIYKLSSNENLLGPSPKALEAIKNNLCSLHEYEHQDDERFRAALSGHVGGRMTASQFLSANSGMELLDLICRGFLSPGDEAILSTPTFLAYQSFALIAGAKVIDVPLEPRDFSLDTRGILAAITENTRLLFISSPNNPTGSIVTENEMDELLRGLPKNILVVYDEVYHHYVKRMDHARAEDYIQQGYPVIGLHSFSKAYGLAGIRLGYAFSTPEIIYYLRQLRRPFMIGSPAVAAGIAALGDGEHIEQTVALVAEEKAFLYLGLERLGVKYFKGEGNFILLWPPYSPGHFAADMLKSGVMVRTCEVFGAPACIRLTVGTREANQAFLNILKLLI